MLVSAGSSVNISLSLEMPHRRHLLPVGLTLPLEKSAAPLPVIFFSHGDGLTGDDYAPLIDRWAGQGFAVIRPTHLTQSGLSHPGPADPDRARLWHDRVTDIRSLIDRLDSIETALPDMRLDPARIFVAGHSYGGHTASILLGARLKATASEDMADPRIAAGILLAPPGGGGAGNLPPEWRARAPYLDLDWSFMRAPALIVAGGKDESPMTVRDWTWRCDAYRLSAAGNKTLLVLPEADHYLGGIAPGRGAFDITDLNAVCDASAFYLAGKAFSSGSAWRSFSQRLRAGPQEKMRLEVR